MGVIKFFADHMNNPVSLPRSRRFLMKLGIFIISPTWPHPSTTSPILWGHEIYNFGRNNASSLYYLSGLAQDSCPWRHEIYNFGRPFLGHHWYMYIFHLCSGEIENKIFRVLHQFYTFYNRIFSCWGECMVMKFTISCLLTLQMLHIKGLDCTL